MNKITIISLSALFFAISTNVATAKIYKWTDANGSVHYSATPPKTKVKAKDIEDKILYAAGKPKYPSADKAEGKSSAKNQVKDEKLAGPGKKLIKYCKQQRTNLRKLKDNFNTRWVDSSGKTTQLTQKQRKDKVKEIKKSITTGCVGV